MMSKDVSAAKILQEIARDTGVNAGDVKKILDHLGLGEALDLVDKHMGGEKLTNLDTKNVVVGVRFANGLIGR
jgi:hypothetical protein